MTKSEGGLPLNAGDRSLGFLLNPDPADATYQKSPGNFHGELHRRLSDWLFAISFALISLVCAGSTRSHRQARVHPMIYALTLAFMIRWLGFYVTNLAEKSTAYTPVVYAVPLVTGAIAIYMLATNRQIQMPRAFTNSMTRMAGALQRRITPSNSGGGTA